MKLKTFFIVFKGLSFGKKLKKWTQALILDGQEDGEVRKILKR